MASRHIHFTGASGSGTSTLGRAVAERLGYAFFDTDDFYWMPTDPPFQTKRDATLRVRLLRAALEQQPAWILAGSLCGWGDELVPSFDLVALLEAPSAIRLARLRQREGARYGVHRVQPGGDLYEHYEAFLTWAAAYDTGGLDVRSRRLHERWLQGLPTSCRVLRIDSTRPIAELTEDVVRYATAGR